MELYSMLKNIYGKNNEDELKGAILRVRSELSNLLEERMCKVYNGYLLNELNKNHVPSRRINTLDLGLDYEHVFVLVPKNDTGYFLSDLTFSQFNNKSFEFDKLLTDGYQEISDQELNYYLNIIEKNNNLEFLLTEDVFYQINNKRR